MVGAFKRIGFGVLVVCTILFIHWNEYESPWGKDVQAHKTAILKLRLCP